MILNINGFILYEIIVLIMVGVKITTLIAYKREKDGLNKEFLSYMLVLTSLFIVSVPLFIYEMLSYLIS